MMTETELVTVPVMELNVLFMLLGLTLGVGITLLFMVMASHNKAP